MERWYSFHWLISKLSRYSGLAQIMMRSPIWVAGPKHLGYLQVLSQTQQGAQQTAEYLGLECKNMEYAGVAGSDLTWCIIIQLVPLKIFFAKTTTKCFIYLFEWQSDIKKWERERGKVSSICCPIARNPAATRAVPGENRRLELSFSFPHGWQESTLSSPAWLGAKVGSSISSGVVRTWTPSNSLTCYFTTLAFNVF